MASSSTKPPPPTPPERTRTILRGPGFPLRAESLSFELSASTSQPRVGLPDSAVPGFVDQGSTKLLRPKLDLESQKQFHRRLRLCCVIATAPLVFLLISAFSNFVELFGRETVGLVGAILCAVVVLLLIGISVLMFRKPLLPERTLRLLEIIVFGSMALFFAYWQFTVQTGLPDEFYRAMERRDALRDIPTRINPEKPIEPTDPMPVRMTSNRVETVRDINNLHESLRVLAAALIVHFNWFILIVFHAVFVPSTISRGVAVTVAMALIPLGIDGVAVATHEPTQHNVVMLFGVALAFLSAASALAIFGTAKQAELQKQVESAREAVREMGQYRLRRKLGQGGMGEVYLAEHFMLKRPCALKRIHSKYLHSPDQLKRFEREVQATARLRHPNTVEIYDYGVAEDGTFYYVMEYLPGLSLEEIVGRYGPMPADRMIHVVTQVCGALREAHEAGLVHRDIKPSNIILNRGGSPHDQIKLVDFGLVHSLAENEQPDRKITRDGLIVGTPEYMSPEQASGGVLDGRSDLFSLGSVAYYLLTGREAFHKENPLKTLLAVVSDNPQPIAELNPFVPDDVLGIVAKCLAKDPAHRVQTAAELERLFLACACSRNWTETRSGEWWEAHPSTESTGTDLASLPLREPSRA
jgi:eukaryotic-like serine/threonine-protein kinase